MLDEAIEYLKSLQLQLQVSTPLKMFLITQDETSMCDVCTVAV
jgi:hypothetical protein